MSKTIKLTIYEDNCGKTNMQRVVEMVLVKNLELERVKLNFEKIRSEYKKARINNRIEYSNYNRLKAEYDLKKAEKIYKDTRNAVIETTIQQYIDVYLKKINIKVKEKRFVAEKSLMEQSECYYKIGGTSSVDLLGQRDKYNNVYFELEKAKNEYTQSLKKFKMTLGLEGSRLEVYFLEKPEVWEISEKMVIETALKNNLQLQLNKKNIIASIQKTYYQFKRAIKNIDLKEENLFEGKVEYEMIKNQYEKGISTKTELLQYEARLLEAEYAYQEAIGDYYLAEHRLMERLGLETGVFIDENIVKIGESSIVRGGLY